MKLDQRGKHLEEVSVRLRDICHEVTRSIRGRASSPSLLPRTTALVLGPNPMAIDESASAYRGWQPRESDWALRPLTLQRKSLRYPAGLLRLSIFPGR